MLKYRLTPLLYSTLSLPLLILKLACVQFIRCSVQCMFGHFPVSMWFDFYLAHTWHRLRPIHPMNVIFILRWHPLPHTWMLVQLQWNIKGPPQEYGPTKRAFFAKTPRQCKNVGRFRWRCKGVWAPGENGPKHRIHLTQTSTNPSILQLSFFDQFPTFNFLPISTFRFLPFPNFHFSTNFQLSLFYQFSTFGFYQFPTFAFLTDKLPKFSFLIQ